MPDLCLNIYHLISGTSLISFHRILILLHNTLRKIINIMMIHVSQTGTQLSWAHPSCWTQLCTCVTGSSPSTCPFSLFSSIAGTTEQPCYSRVFQQKVSHPVNPLTLFSLGTTLSRHPLMSSA